MNPYFKDNLRLLGDYRKIFEPKWNPALAAVRAERMSSEDKLVLAGYRALLSICAPETPIAPTSLPSRMSVN